MKYICKVSVFSLSKGIRWTAVLPLYTARVASKCFCPVESSSQAMPKQPKQLSTPTYYYMRVAAPSSI